MSVIFLPFHTTQAQNTLKQETLADTNFPESSVIVFAILTFMINLICRKAWPVQCGALGLQWSGHVHCK